MVLQNTSCMVKVMATPLAEYELHKSGLIDRFNCCYANAVIKHCIAREFNRLHARVDFQTLRVMMKSIARVVKVYEGATSTARTHTMTHYLVYPMMTFFRNRISGQ